MPFKLSMAVGHRTSCDDIMFYSRSLARTWKLSGFEYERGQAVTRALAAVLVFDNLNFKCFHFSSLDRSSSCALSQ